MARHFFISAALASSLFGCASVEERYCGPGEQPAIADLLYFGTAKPGGPVSPEEWSSFLRDAVTPRFPEGLTAWPASGQWQAADGSLTQEGAFVLSLVHAADDASEAAIRTVAAEYKSRFRQEAVLRVKSYVCISF